jgi:hypothetical protein
MQLAFASSAIAGSQPPIYVDPQANSPAGTIYAIPLDSARQDAAPHRRASSHRSHHSATGAIGSAGSGGGGSSTGTGTGTGGGGGSAGGTGVASSTGGGAGGSSVVLVPGGQPGSLVHSGNGFGSSSRVPGLTAPASVGFHALGSGASNAPLLAILLAAVVVALGLLAGGRAWRLSHPLEHHGPDLDHRSTTP